MIREVHGHSPKNTEANDGVAFAMTGVTEETGIKNKKGQKEKQYVL
jgi:hypothetical protein